MPLWLTYHPDLMAWIQSAFYYPLTSILFILAGTAILPVSNFGLARPQLFRASLSFFAGQMLFLALFRISAAVVGRTDAAFHISAAVIFALGAFESYRFVRSAKSESRIALASVAAVSLYAFFMLNIVSYWMPYLDFEKQSSLWGHFGSMHSGRYILIADHFIQSNQIASIGQNFGQSLLVVAHWLSGLDGPYFCLATWIAIGLVFFSLMTFSYFDGLGHGWMYSAQGTCFVLFCNTGLSLLSIFLVDGGTPIIGIGYADVALGLGSLFGVLAWLPHALDNKAQTGKILSRESAFLFVMGIGWSYTAPQNQVLVGLLLGTISLLALRAFPLAMHLNKKRVFALASVLCIGSAIGISLGGLLTPMRLRDSANVEGVMSTQGDETGLRFDPHLQFAYRFYNWEKRSFPKSLTAESLQNNTSPFRTLIERSRGRDHLERIRSIIAHTEGGLWTSVKVLFFPIVSIILSIIILRMRSKITDEQRANVAYLLGVTLLFFVPVFLLTFFFTYNGFKFPLNRFYYPSILTSIIGLWYCLGLFSAGPWWRRFRYVLFATATFGPVMYLSTQFYGLYIDPKSARSLLITADVLVNQKFVPSNTTTHDVSPQQTQPKDR